jgi:hypothetical protein
MRNASHIEFCDEEFRDERGLDPNQNSVSLVDDNACKVEMPSLEKRA